MMKIFLSILMSIVLVGCSSRSLPNEPPTSQELSVENSEVNQALKVLEKNLKALTEKDVEMYAETIHSNNKEATIEQLQHDFENEFNIQVTFSLMNVITYDVDENLITMEVEQLAKGEDPTEFRSHTSINEHKFTKEDNNWVIIESQVLDINFLEDQL